MSDASIPESGNANETQTAAVESTELLPGDAYLDGPYLVFTEQFHLRRGYCCNSDCRHCPYRAG